MSSLFKHTANYLRLVLPKQTTPQTIPGQGAARTVPETSRNIDPQRASALLVSLPVEMLNLIVSYLTLESEVAFALTCRLLYRLYMPPKPRLRCLEDEQKRDLLLWLERDTPQLCFCHACMKLHTWSRVPRVVDQDIYYPQLCPKQIDDPLLSMPHPLYGIRYGQARLIMRRHLYGDSYGLELETLNRDRLVEARISYPPTGVGVMVKQSWRARIINDELYVKATMEIYHRKGCARTFGQCLYNPTFEFEQSRVCHHVWACHDPYWRVSTGGYSVQEVHRDDCLPDMIFTRSQGPLKSCPHCFTDFRISTKYIRHS
ncbi:hypothetical protein N656DRAFT_422775 [Canariomyces notabilis]|uniref:F-box domain-containing protein n=1 Tax=Canariomyces notabilis TaxID=2074819 RepID=A0AAN6QE22_9PEZI|nr:hypothetical protein N656DRAFT_422775 [Canariomyces arenarius]